MHIITGPIFRRAFLLLTAATLLSAVTSSYLALSPYAFFVIIAAVLALTLRKLEYGVLAVIGELVIGSKGLLFYVDIGGALITIRMALWIIVLGVWCMHALRGKEQETLRDLVRQPITRIVVLLGTFVAVGLVIGLTRNATSDVLLDVNGWLFAALLPAFLSVMRDPRVRHAAITTLIAGALINSLVALALVFIFAHDPLHGVYLEFYRWLRSRGIGEATIVSPTFVRVFLQSQIYTIIAAFILLRDGNLKHPRYWIITSIMAAGLLASFSRSFWVGIGCGLVVLVLMSNWRTLARTILIATAAAGLLFFLVNFPYPKTDGANLVNLVEDRVTNGSESAVGSRWNLLPVLWERIRENPILGTGFGSTVTYRSNDPRVLESTAQGNNLYTTYAFEWGYLDIWLKIGIVGLGTYLALLLGISIALIRSTGFAIRTPSAHLSIALLAGLVALAATNVFSPYLNHPLGIGYILLLIGILQGNKSESPSLTSP